MDHRDGSNLRSHMPTELRLFALRASTRFTLPRRSACVRGSQWEMIIGQRKVIGTWGQGRFRDAITEVFGWFWMSRASLIMRERGTGFVVHNALPGLSVFC